MCSSADGVKTVKAEYVIAVGGIQNISLLCIGLLYDFSVSISQNFFCNNSWYKVSIQSICVCLLIRNTGE